MELTLLFITLKEKLKYQRNYKVKLKTILEYLGGRNVIAFDIFFGRSSCKANTMKLAQSLCCLSSKEIRISNRHADL